MEQSLSLTPEQVENALARCGKGPEWATGFFAALHTGPATLVPSDWVPHFTPEAGFADTEDATTSIVTLLHLYNRIGSVMTDNPAVLCPDPGDAEGVEQWCSGYIDGVRMHPAWKHDAVAMAGATVIAILAGEVPTDEMRDPDGKRIPDVEDWLDCHRVELREHVRNLWTHWAPARKAAASLARASKQTGRNDPCPCGSGKKYKKCHLEALTSRR